MFDNYIQNTGTPSDKTYFGMHQISLFRLNFSHIVKCRTEVEQNERGKPIE